MDPKARKPVAHPCASRLGEKEWAMTSTKKADMQPQSRLSGKLGTENTFSLIKLIEIRFSLAT
jgi:hypothetical protein